jgi:hypothetical protein
MMKEVERKLTLDLPATYEINVPGHLDESWTEWDGRMTITVEEDGAVLGPLLSAKAALWGHNAALRASLGQFDTARDYRAELNPPDSIIGSPDTTVSYAQYTACPANLIAEEYRQVQPSDVETLRVSGSIDFDTPVQYARDELLPALSTGRQVIVSEFGHVEFVTLQPEATERLLTSLCDTGTADDSLFTCHLVNFDVGLGHPAMAKLGLTVVVLIIVGVGALVWFIGRRLRRRRAGLGLS